MNKELKALKTIIMYCDEEMVKNEISLIANALKNYQELLERPCILVGRTHGSSQALIDKICKNHKEIKITNLENEKKLKALEIITRYCSFSFKEITKTNFEHYQVIIDCGIESIRIFIPPERKSDYDLLKEALNEKERR